jgi:hypothetical protein
MVHLRSDKTAQATKGGQVMFTKYAIVPYVAQARQFALPESQHPALISQQYGQALLQFLEPLLRE